MHDLLCVLFDACCSARQLLAVHWCLKPALTRALGNFAVYFLVVSVGNRAVRKIEAARASATRQIGVVDLLHLHVHNFAANQASSVLANRY